MTEATSSGILTGLLLILSIMSESENTGFEARLTLAQAETTPAKVLTEMAIFDRNPQIRRAIALNLNTPTDILLELGEEFPNEITQNPIFRLLEGFDCRFVRLSLARSTTTDENTLIQLSELKDVEIHHAIARNPKTPLPVLEKLAQRYRQQSERPAVQRLSTDRFLSLLSFLVGGLVIVAAPPFSPFRYESPTYTCYCILSAIVQNPNVPESLLHTIVGFRNNKVNALLLQNPNTSTAILEEIASVTTYPVHSGAFHDDINPEVMRNHPNSSETALALMHAMRGIPGVPSAILERLANHPDFWVRSNVVTHPELSLELLLKLKDSKVYFPPQTIKRITELIFQNLLSPNHLVTFENEVLFWIARNSGTPILILEDIAFNQSDDIHERLGEDQFKRLRTAVASNLATPSYILRRLSLDPEAQVRDAAQSALLARQSTR